MLGIGLSYAKVYLFHIVLVINIAFILYDIIQKRKFIAFAAKQNLAAGLKTFWWLPPVWFAVLVLVADYKSEAIQYTAIVAMGAALFYSLQYYITTKKEWIAALRVVAVCVAVEMAVALLEMTAWFRYPISSLSLHNDWFGRANIVQIEIDAYKDRVPVAQIIEELQHTPTGFHWHPNDMAVVLAMAFPFLLFYKPRWWSYSGIFLIVAITTFTNARLVFLSLILMSVASVFFVVTNKNLLAAQKKAVYRSMAFALLVIGGFCTNFYTFHDLFNSHKLREMQLFATELTHLAPRRNIAESSETIRPQLLDKAKNTIIAQRGVGIGGGNFKAAVLHETGGYGKKRVASLHNHWLEVAVEGGALYLILYGAWLCVLAYRLWQITRAKTDTIYIGVDIDEYIGAPLAVLVALVGFAFTAMAPSSCVYLLPIYVLYGFAYKLTILNKTE